MRIILAAAAAAWLAAFPVATTAGGAQQGIRQERVAFAKGATSATIKGQLLKRA